MDGDHRRTEVHEAIYDLVDVAGGRKKATLALRRTNLVDVNIGVVEEGLDIAVYRDRIAAVGRNLDYAIGGSTTIVDGEGYYATPGFMDAHIHVESSMLTPARFAEVVLPLGTTAIFADPHEIANVLGTRGVMLFIEESGGLQLKVFFLVPSCVPASSAGLETSGQRINMEELYRYPAVIGLGEVMDYPSVVDGKGEILDKVSTTLRKRMAVEGHAPQLDDRELAAYAAAGISSCHESTSKEEALEKLKLGMYAYVREGSAWLDLRDTIRVVTEDKIDTRHVVLVTDDRDSLSLLKEGHINYVTRKAIGAGVDPITAVQMVTLNVAEHFGLAQQLGSIAPVRSADILLFRRLTDLKPHLVIADGIPVAREGKLLVDIRRMEYPGWARRTMNTGTVDAGKLIIRVPTSVDEVIVRVMKVRGDSVMTREEHEVVGVKDGSLLPSPEDDLSYAVVVERHKGTGNVGKGFVRGFTLKRGAVASSVSHDAHNIIAVGANIQDIEAAINRVIILGGGIVAASDGVIDAEQRLPIAGLITDEPATEVADSLEILVEAWRRYGCELPYPFMTMSLLTLTVIPELRITDRGLVDVRRQILVPLTVDDNP